MTSATALVFLILALVVLVFALKRRTRTAKPTGMAWRFCPSCRGNLVNVDVGGKAKLGCERCDFVHWNNPKPNCKTLIPTTDGGLVLVRVPSGALELPGGYTEPWETLVDGAEREALEETHLKVKVVRELAVHMPDKRNEHHHFFLCEPVSEKPTGDDDVLEALIVPRDKIPFDEIKSRPHREVIAQWLKETVAK